MRLPLRSYAAFILGFKGSYVTSVTWSLNVGTMSFIVAVAVALAQKKPLSYLIWILLAWRHIYIGFKGAVFAMDREQEGWSQYETFI